MRDGVVNVGNLVEGTGKGIGKELGHVLSHRGRDRKSRKGQPPSLNTVFNSSKNLRVASPARPPAE